MGTFLGIICQSLAVSFWWIIHLEIKVFVSDCNQVCTDLEVLLVALSNHNEIQLLNNGYYYHCCSYIILKL